MAFYNRFELSNRFFFLKKQLLTINYKIQFDK